MDLKLNNKKVLVVGASKGIGRSITTSFAKEGALVTFVARSEDLLKEILETMHDKQLHQYYVADVMDGTVHALAEQLLKERGTFDVVVHNVGGSLIGRDPLGTIEEWEYALKFNAGTAIDMNHVLIQPMVQQGWGRVIHISSISAVMLRGNPLYASAKAFLNAYVTTVGRALAPKGIVMSAVMPGAVAFEDSYWTKQIEYDDAHPEEFSKYQDFLRHHQAADRFGTPQEIADVVLFMASEQASFMPAALIPVDGANM